MAGVQKVRKRDGREVPFDPRRIAAAIDEAASATGACDPLLADELAEVVKLFLDRDFAERVPGVDDIHDLVERVLIETGNAGAAKAYILNRHKRAEQLAQLEVRVNRPVAVSSVGVTSPIRQSRWNKQKIVEALLLEADLDLARAEEVADAVERRVFKSGLSRISVSLIRELVDIELFERGLDAPLARQQTVGLPRYDLERLLRASGGGEVRATEEAAGRALLARYALEALLPGPVAQAHLEGRLHVGELEAPERYLDLALALPAPPRVPDLALCFDRLGVHARALTARTERDLIVFGLEPWLALEEGPAAVERLIPALVDPGRARAPGRVVMALSLSPESVPGREPLPGAILGALLGALQRADGPDREGAPRLRLTLTPALLDEAELLETALQLEARGQLEFVRVPSAEALLTPLVGRTGVNLLRVARAAGGWHRLREELGDVLELAAQAGACRVRWLKQAAPLALAEFGVVGAGAGAGAAGSRPRVSVVPVHLSAALGVLGGSARGESENLAADLLSQLGELFASRAAAHGLDGELWVEPYADAEARLGAIDAELEPGAREALALPALPIEVAGTDPWQRLRPDPSQSLSERLAHLRGAALLAPGSVAS